MKLVSDITKHISDTLTSEFGGTVKSFPFYGQPSMDDLYSFFMGGVADGYPLYAFGNVDLNLSQRNTEGTSFTATAVIEIYWARNPMQENPFPELRADKVLLGMESILNAVTGSNFTWQEKPYTLSVLSARPLFSTDEVDCGLIRMEIFGIDYDYDYITQGELSEAY